MLFRMYLPITSDAHQFYFAKSDNYIQVISSFIYFVVFHQVNKIILENGWRCLDCTLCEGCGKGSDEARLLLCDTCDISYHTYCLDPPLEKVPQGGWKCKW